MKKNLFLSSILVMATLNVIFASCSSDDEDSGNTLDRGGAAITVNGKRLVGSVNSEDNDTLFYEYNSLGKIAMVFDKDYKGTYSYDDGKITSSYSYSSSYSSSLSSNYSFKGAYNSVYSLSNGRITKNISNTTFSLTSSTSNSESVEDYEYDDNGYLYAIRYTSTDSDTYGNTKTDSKTTQTTIYTWKDGNLINEKTTYTNQNTTTTTTTTYSYVGGSYSPQTTNSTSTSTYESTTINEYIYTDHPNILPAFSSGTDTVLGWQGYFGKSSKNMPQKVVTTTTTKTTKSASSSSSSSSPSSETTTTITTYDYTFTDGVVTKLIKTIMGKTTDIYVTNYIWK